MTPADETKDQLRERMQTHLDEVIWFLFTSNPTLEHCAQLFTIRERVEQLLDEQIYGKQPPKVS